MSEIFLKFGCVTASFKKYIKGKVTPEANKEFVMKAINYYCRYLERQRGINR